MRDIRSIKAAVFDLDGTLLDSTAAWEGLGERYLAGRGITPEPGLDEKLRCMALPDGSAYLKSAYSLPEPPDEILRDILRGIEEFYLAECPLKPGAQELLGRLSRRGVGISAATAGDERLARAALERLARYIPECGSRCGRDSGKHRGFRGFAPCAPHREAGGIPRRWGVRPRRASAGKTQSQRRLLFQKPVRLLRSIPGYSGLFAEL